MNKITNKIVPSGQHHKFQIQNDNIECKFLESLCIDGEKSSKHTSNKWPVVARVYQIPSHDDYELHVLI
jgi:hypothetical protein